MDVWGISQDEFVGGFLRGAGGPQVPHVLHQWEPLCPRVLVLSANNAEILFEGLVSPLTLSVCLRMVGCADVLFDSQESAEFACEVTCELGVSVRDDLLRESVVRDDLLHV